MKIGQKFYLTEVIDGVETGICVVSLFKQTLKSFRVYNKDNPEVGRLVFDITTFRSLVGGKYRIHHSKQSFLDQAKSSDLAAQITKQLGRKLYCPMMLDDILTKLLDN